MFPELFEIVSEEMKWYDSLGFVENQYIPNEIAKNYAMETIIDPHDNPTAVDSVAQSFMEGLCWYVDNYRIIETLSNEEQEIAIKIAKLRYSMETVELYVEYDYNKSDVITMGDSVEEDYECGIEWGAERHHEKLIIDYLLKIYEGTGTVLSN